jgi:hypothetical protein
MIIYSAKFVDASGREDYQPLGLDETDAIAEVEKLVKKYPDDQIYLCFFRESDGQRGYINRDGADITGEPW